MIALHAALLATTIASAPPPSIEAATIAIAGEINAAFVEELKSKLSPTTKLVVVESAGGEEATAIDVGQILLERGISVRVDSYCLSACALYVLAGAKDVKVSPLALVGFHTPALGTAQLLQSAAPTSEKFKEIDGVARRSVDFYARAKKNPKILIDAFYGSDVDCLLLMKQDGIVRSVRIRSAVDVWVPERSTLAGGGWKIEGYWPASEADTLALSKKYLKSDAVIKFGPTPAMPRKLDITVSEASCPAKRI